MVSLAHGTQRRAEDDGRHHARADRQRHDRRQGAKAPFWVILSCALAISLGTYIGGWRVIRTLGKGLVEIESPQGMAAESVLGRDDPAVQPLRLLAVDDARRDRLDPRHRARPEGRRGPLERGRPDGHRLARDPAAAGARRRAVTYGVAHGIGGTAGDTRRAGLPLVAVAGMLFARVAQDRVHARQRQRRVDRDGRPDAATRSRRGLSRTRSPDERLDQPHRAVADPRASACSPAPGCPPSSRSASAS